ncbi:unnamed protein product [Rhizophagus irregularis]|nr:unnamed protein product [Rhizophagus irregularis]
MEAELHAGFKEPGEQVKSRASRKNTEEKLAVINSQLNTLGAEIKASFEVSLERSTERLVEAIRAAPSSPNTLSENVIKSKNGVKTTILEEPSLDTTAEQPSKKSPQEIELKGKKTSIEQQRLIDYLLGGQDKNKQKDKESRLMEITTLEKVEKHKDFKKQIVTADLEATIDPNTGKN